MKRNWHLKVISFILAAIIWFYVDSNDKPIDKLINIPLVKIGPSQDLALVSIIPDKVGLYIKGPLSRIKRLEEAGREGVLKAELDLRHAKEGTGEFTVRIRGANLRWMQKEIIPAMIEIEIERYAETTASPERLIIGGLPPDTNIVLETGLPETVKVSGAKSLVSQVNRVVYRLTEADLVGYEHVTVDFAAHDAEGKHIINVDITPPTAELEIGIRKTGASRRVPVGYNYMGHPPSGYTVTSVNINPSFITLNGPPEVLKDIHRVETEPIDLTGHSDNFTIQALKLIKPDEQVMMETNTVMLEVKIEHITTQRRFEGLPVNFDGGGDESLIHYSSNPRTVSITVVGPVDEIEKLTREMINPMVNVRGLAEGLHENRPVYVPIMMPQISLVEIEPDAVTVTVKKREEFNLGNEGDDE